MKTSLRDVMLYLVYNAVYPPTKTSLMKLTYMADYYYWQLHGEKMTDSEYVLDRYGAVCYDIPDLAALMDKNELRLTRFLSGSSYQLSYQMGPESLSDFDLTTDVKEVLDAVILRHSSQSLPALKAAHYQTEPMQAARIKGERLDFTKVARRLKTKDYPQMRALQERLSQVQVLVKGSPEEHAQHRNAVMSSLSLARKRANSVRLKGDKQSLP